MGEKHKFWDRREIVKRLSNSFTADECRCMAIAGGRMCRPAGLTDAEWDAEKVRARKVANKALREMARVSGREKLVETVHGAETAFELAPVLAYIVPRAQEEPDDGDQGQGFTIRISHGSGQSVEIDT